MTSFTIICNECENKVELKDIIKMYEQNIRFFADAYGDMCSGIEIQGFNIQCEKCSNVINLDD